MAIRTSALAVLVAIVAALAVPVASLRLVTSVATRCCCPDPDRCHCPHDQSPDGTTMGNCHGSSSDSVTPEMPAFESPIVAVVEAPAAIVSSPVFEIPTPHVAPPPARPDAPS